MSSQVLAYIIKLKIREIVFLYSEYLTISCLTVSGLDPEPGG